MSLFVFYIVTTVHNLLTIALNLLQNIENGHQAHQTIGLTCHRANFWVRLGLAYLMRTTAIHSRAGLSVGKAVGTCDSERRGAGCLSFVAATLTAAV
jgi:hypothetical protein